MGLKGVDDDETLLVLIRTYEERLKEMQLNTRERKERRILRGEFTMVYIDNILKILNFS